MTEAGCCLAGGKKRPCRKESRIQRAKFGLCFQGQKACLGGSALIPPVPTWMPKHDMHGDRQVLPIYYILDTVTFRHEHSSESSFALYFKACLLGATQIHTLMCVKRVDACACRWIHGDSRNFPARSRINLCDIEGRRPLRAGPRAGLCFKHGVGGSSCGGFWVVL